MCKRLLLAIQTRQKIKTLCVSGCLTGDTGGAVDENKDHAAEGPSDTENANAAAGVSVVGLALVANDGQNGDVEEEQGGDELGD